MPRYPPQVNNCAYIKRVCNEKMRSRLTGGKVIQDHPLVGVDLLTIHSVLHTIPEACVPLGPIILIIIISVFGEIEKFLPFLLHPE